MSDVVSALSFASALVPASDSRTPVTPVASEGFEALLPETAVEDFAVSIAEPELEQIAPLIEAEELSLTALLPEEIAEPPQDLTALEVLPLVQPLPPQPSTPVVEALRFSLLPEAVPAEVPPLVPAEVLTKVDMKAETRGDTPVIKDETSADLAADGTELAPVARPAPPPTALSSAEIVPQAALAHRIAMPQDSGPSLEPDADADADADAVPELHAMPEVESPPNTEAATPKSAVHFHRAQPEVAPSPPFEAMVTVQSEAAEPAMLDALPTEPLRVAAAANAVQSATQQAAPERSAHLPPLVKNVLERLAELELSEGKTRLLLKPQGMGTLEIDMLRQMDGRLQVAIRVENPLVLDALRQEGNALGLLMGEKGFDLSGGGPAFEQYVPPDLTADSDGRDDLAVSDHPSSDQPVVALLRADRLDITT